MTETEEKKNVIVIVGRPNVGKSSLLNRLAGHRISIVHEEAGVTRDRVEVKLDWKGIGIHLIDTGGIDPKAKDSITRQIREQVKVALKDATLLLFVVDALSGVTGMDEDVAQWIRESGKKTVLVINKADNNSIAADFQDFYRLGFKEICVISAMHGMGAYELMETLEKYLKKIPLEHTDAIRVSVLGKPNAGKSTMINYLLGENRLLVDSVPGTTRDAVDVDIVIHDRLFTFVDTAGVRKRKQVRRGPETFSVMRTIQSIRRADLIILVIDINEGITAQDIRILEESRKQLKGCVIALNKWDLIKGVSEKDFSKMMIDRWKMLEMYPHVYCSGLKGLHFDRLIKQVMHIYDNSKREIPEEELEDFLRKIQEKHQPPSHDGHMPKFYAMTQKATQPPQFDILVNQTKWIKPSYKLYIENELRKKYDFFGIPIQFRYKRG